MNVIHTFRGKPGFDLQVDVHLMQGVINRAPGPDRLYLLHPYRDDAGMAGEETAGIWNTSSPAAVEIATEVLALPDATPNPGKPWFVLWIRGGEIVVRKHWLGLDRGIHLIGLLAPYDLLDRREHLMGFRDQAGD